jgi:hypothetical protein
LRKKSGLDGQPFATLRGHDYSPTPLPMKHFFICLSLLFFGVSAFAQNPIKHAHNDYEHPHPLTDALAAGFHSVEADVYLIGGDLFVAHERPGQPDTLRNLRNLYLKPLAAIIQKNGGKVYPNDTAPFFLMIDIKTQGEAVYELLKKQLAPYQSMLTRYTDKDMQYGACTVFISGDRPFSTLLRDSVRYIALDGRPGDIGKGYTVSQMPVISDSYASQVKWFGKGPIPVTEQQRLNDLVAAVHKEGKRLRLWASPESVDVWKVLFDAKVDFLNTDHLEELSQFLKAQAERK